MDARRYLGFCVPLPGLSGSLAKSPRLCRGRPLAASQKASHAISCCARVASPTLKDIEDAIEDVLRLYGDLEDEYQEFHRWSKAQDDIEESGLRKRMHSSELTYGEFDLKLLGRALQLAMPHLKKSPGKRLFVDIGSGYGRAVHAAARMLGEAWECVGLEIVPGMHAYAVEVHAEALSGVSDSSVKGAEEVGALQSAAPLGWASRVHFYEGDYTEDKSPAETALHKADVCFCFATTWPSGGTPYLTTMTSVLGRRLRDGVIAMTADKQLVTDVLGPDGSRFELLHEVSGPNKCVGDSTVFVYRYCRGLPAP